MRMRLVRLVRTYCLAMTLPISSSPKLLRSFHPKRRMLSIRCQASRRSINKADTQSQEIPGAAVSTIVQCRMIDQEQLYYYLLVQRGNHPNKGMWSLPGGKIEWRESILSGAQRELFEETVWPDEARNNLQWYPQTIGATESMGDGYHYLIAQCYAQLSGCSSLPRLQPADDAAQCNWFLPSEMQQLPMTPGVNQLIQRVEELSEKGLLL